MGVLNSLVSYNFVSFKCNLFWWLFFGCLTNLLLLSCFYLYSYLAMCDAGHRISLGSMMDLPSDKNVI